MKVYFGRKFIILNNVYFVPDFSKNLISFGRLEEQGFSFNIDNGIELFSDGCFITKAQRVDSIYYLYPVEPSNLDTEVNNDSLGKRKRSHNDEADDTYLWHLRLGHISLDRIKRLTKDGPMKSLHVGTIPTCESCLKGKMTKRPFSSKGLRATHVLELVHTDVCGPFNIQARGNYEYFVTFTDDYSRFGYVYLM